MARYIGDQRDDLGERRQPCGTAPLAIRRSGGVMNNAMHKLVDQRTFHKLASVGDTAGAAVERLGSVVRATDNGSRVVTFCFSDGSVDRVGDKINPHGWQLSGFKANPVCLWAHLSNEPPIGRVLRTYVAAERLMGDIEFASAEVYPFADQVYRLVVNRFINSVSVGFLPVEWKFSDDDSRGFGIDFLRQELLEISVVPVPANANALVQAAAVKGLAVRGAALSERTESMPSTLQYAGTARERRWHLAQALRRGI
jgi:HK97 family phage prohead protease